MRWWMRTVLGVMVVPGLAVSAPAGAATERWVFTESFDYVTGSGCGGESLHVVGTVTSALRVTETPTGKTLTSGHTNADMTATGTVTGDPYRIVDIREITTNVDGDGVRQGIGAWAFLIVGPGPGDNLLVTNQYHVTVTPDGDVTADLFNVTSKCVG